MSIEFLGKGLCLDFCLDSRGSIKMSSYEDSVQESIHIILGTKCGERVYTPKFGCRIHELMFEPNDVRTQTLANKYVTQALNWFEPRIKLLEVRVNSMNENSINIEISYEIVDSNQAYNLVYPFYLVPQ